MKFKVKVFFSYATADKEFAESIKLSLNDYPFIEIFMAPESIRTGTFFVNELRYSLKNSDVVLVLLTDNYHKADWTEQEIGLAWAFEKKIVALSIDNTNGNGYITNIQIKPFSRKFNQWQDITKLAIDIYPEIEDKKEFVEGLLKFGLLASRNFSESIAVANLMKSLVDQIDSELAMFVVEAYCKNDQVHKAATWNNLIEKSFCSPKPFIHFNEIQKIKMLEFIIKNQPEYYLTLKKQIEDFENLKK